MGASFDWSKEVVTADPSYYQWTQWLFSKLFEHGLAERREASVKWCPVDKTVLANEQVIDGACERCGTTVEEKRLTQWFLKITDYAERLLDGLEDLPWREEIKEAQRAWIGKSEGAYLDFALVEREEKVRVFTTRPDTLFGATYVVLAPEHSLITTLSEGGQTSLTNAEEVTAYIKATAQKTERERSENKEKTGVKLEGVMAINPANKEEVPVYVADYVLGSYGTGAVMAVPAHDERDREFAEKYGLPIVDKEFVDWDVIEAAGGEKATQYRLRDWSVSRQRYWGCPLPIVYDPEGKPHAVPTEHLPWLLPTDVDFKPTGEASPLASSQELKERVEKIFGEGWTPEYDTLDTFVDSSWYFLRYLDPKDTHDFSDAALMKKWLPVNRYSGGSEHTTMHLLYARFFTKALHDLALVDIDEPFVERFNRGLIMGPDGQKMSKSKGNVINPDDFVQKFGADAVRVYLAFIGPYNEPGSYPWNLDGVMSMRRFLDRVERLVLNNIGTVAINRSELEKGIAKTAKKVLEDGDRFKFNTAIAALMTLLSTTEKVENVPQEVLQQFVIMLAPFAPHLAEHLWEQLGGKGSVHAAIWPESDQALLVEAEAEVVVQVNGKRRGAVMLAVDTPQEEAETVAKQLGPVLLALAGREARRVVYVPGKILNIVV
jgi:leucyl-tRNA synthetase